MSTFVFSKLVVQLKNDLEVNDSNKNNKGTNDNIRSLITD